MGSANMHSSPLGKTESSTSHGAPESLDGVTVAIKGMSVDEKVNTSSLEEKIADDEPLADATKQEKKDISKCSLKDAALVKSLLKDATKQERKDLFKSLLKDSNVSSDWTWEQAIRVIINDIRLIALDTKAERDQTFNEYIEQRKKEEDFKRMLEDSRELTASMTWSKAVALFENDKRYKAVDQASDREDLFGSYCVDQQKKYHEDKSRVEGALNLKKVTVLTTWTFEDFKAALGKDIISSLSYFNLQLVFLDLIEMEKEKEKELKKRQCLAKDFTELLNNMEDITASSTWEECHHLLKESSEYRAISDETIAHEIFTEHVACLAEKAQKKRKREDEKARKEDKMKRKEKEKERLKKDYSDSTEHEENKKREKDEDRKRRKFRHHGSDQIRSREDASSRDSRKHHRHSSDHEKTRKDASSCDSRKHHRHSSDHEKTRKDASSRDSRKHHRHSSDHEKTRKDSYSAESESDSERKHKKHKKDSRY